MSTRATLPLAVGTSLLRSEVKLKSVDSPSPAFILRMGSLCGATSVKTLGTGPSPRGGDVLKCAVSTIWIPAPNPAATRESTQNS
jgi:hypothetical protein